MMNKGNVSCVEVVTMRCRRSFCGVTKYDGVRNKVTWHMTGVQAEIKGKRGTEYFVMVWTIIITMEECSVDDGSWK